MLHEDGTAVAGLILIVEAEDLADLVVLAERRNEPTVPHSQFITELKRDGII